MPGNTLDAFYKHPHIMFSTPCKIGVILKENETQEGKLFIQ